jgi:NitT/TauT family transport system substrate-binding protein
LGLLRRTTNAPRTEGNVITRRDFLARASALGASPLLGLPGSAAAEPPPEVTSIRLIHAPSICLAPQLLAEALLRLEGFADVQYVELAVNKLSSEVASGRADLSQVATPEIIPVIDAGEPVVVLAGVHAGCYELFAHQRVRRISDIKARKVVISALGSPEHTYVSSIAAYVGMNPVTDIDWVIADSSTDAMHLFAAGKADAFLAFPPQPQELRSNGVGRVIVDTTNDRPWSQYFCCVVSGNQDFVRKHPWAAKRALRAMLKATDLCASEPERVARYLVARNYASRHELALEVLTALPYRRWRQSHPEDTIRFHALRLYEVGMIKTAPNKLIAQGTDWRFLNELKRELKA